MMARGIGLRSYLLAGVLILVSRTGAPAGTVGLSAHLSGPSGGSGDAAFVLDDTNGVLVSAVTFDLTDSFMLASAVITNGSNGPVLHTLDTSLVSGLTQGSFTDIWTGLTSSDIQTLESFHAYITITTTQSPTGDIQGQIVPEPSSLVLGVGGAMVLLGAGWLRRPSQERGGVRPPSRDEL
jgi:hypothetical protein